MSSSIDHSMFYREQFAPGRIGEIACDVFLSAYNDSERVRSVFSGVDCSRKIWLVHEEYDYSASELPSGDVYVPSDSGGEAEWWLVLFEEFGLSELDPSARVVIDITGMMRPHILVMPLMFRQLGLQAVTVLYSDPTGYMQGSKTRFSKGRDVAVRQVNALEGEHQSAGAGDALIIGAGYDFDLVRAVAEEKNNCKHFVVLGLPSLQPHMYQESQLNLADAAESLIGFSEGSLIFAPADNPFATATVLQERVREIQKRTPDVNLYLCPVGSKAQVLGFGWYFLTEMRNGPSSVLFPFKSGYTRETSVGFARVHRFTMELECIPL